MPKFLVTLIKVLMYAKCMYMQVNYEYVRRESNIKYEYCYLSLRLPQLFIIFRVLKKKCLFGLNTRIQVNYKPFI